ncbi:MAG: HEAT repeat domain-containing protein [Elusimicrobiota bacterium]
MNPLFEKRPSQVLFEKALTARLGGKVFWDCVSELRRRGTREIFLTAKELCLSNNQHRRCLGIDVLCQLRTEDPNLQKTPSSHNTRPVFVQESIRLIRPFLSDRRIEVLTSAIYALGHMNDPKRAKLLSHLSTHRNRDVRHAIATALGSGGGPLGRQILINLSADKDPEVRNWATFGIGTLSETNSVAVREALAKRLHDRCKDARYEAIVGLAKRKDPRAIEHILHDLKTTNPRVFTLDAAREFGHPIFLLLLKAQWKTARKEKLTDSYWGAQLKDAITACEQGRQLR